MKILLLSAAALALLAAPALAQQPGHHPDSSFQRPALGRAAQHPGQQRAQPQPSQQPQAPQRQQAQTPRPNRSQPGRDYSNQAQPNRSQPNRGNRYDNRQSDNRRPDYRRPDNRQSDYRRPYNSRSHAHADWSRMRNYHRNYSAPRRFHAPSYYRPNGWYARRWSWGDFLPSLFWSSQYWINNYGIYDLPPPPPGTVWVRNGDDAILIDRYSGEIIQVVYGIFY